MIWNSVSAVIQHFESFGFICHVWVQPTNSACPPDRKERIRMRTWKKQASHPGAVGAVGYVF